MRENRPYGSEGVVSLLNTTSRPLSLVSLFLSFTLKAVKQIQWTPDSATKRRIPQRT